MARCEKCRLLKRLHQTFTCTSFPSSFVSATFNAHTPLLAAVVHLPRSETLRGICLSRLTCLGLGRRSISNSKRSSTILQKERKETKAPHFCSFPQPLFGWLDTLLLMSCVIAAEASKSYISTVVVRSRSRPSNDTPSFGKRPPRSQWLGLLWTRSPELPNSIYSQVL